LLIEPSLTIDPLPYSGKDPSDMPSYQELLEENQRLRNSLAAANSKALDRPEPSLPMRPKKPQHLLESPDALEQMLLESPPSAYDSYQNLDQAHIIVPSRECSNALVAYDKKWNSWVHYALEYPTFEHEHENFMDSLENGATLSDLDPAWLSVYFSVLSVSASASEYIRKHLLTVVLGWSSYGR
jgi:hypothetical protein